MTSVVETENSMSEFDTEMIEVGRSVGSHPLFSVATLPRSEREQQYRSVLCSASEVEGKKSEYVGARLLDALDDVYKYLQRKGNLPLSVAEIKWVRAPYGEDAPAMDGFHLFLVQPSRTKA